jgi:phthiocerol/phenolphthiocerol synthesis type-I polyketide synthase E
MPELSNRFTDLSPEKQQLLRRLLGSRPAEPPARPSETAASQSVPMPARMPPPVAASNPDAKGACRQFFDTVSEQLNASAFGPYSFFLNYGYVPKLNPQYSRVQLPDRMLNKNSVQLVLEVLEDGVTPDSAVLDIGCGRGGTIFVITQFFRAARVVGLALSSAAIAFCRRAHQYPDVSFLQGDSEQLPFRDGFFDVVINIESSSCYPDPVAFYSEVRRVLAGGGRFLYADCLPIERFEEGIQFLKRTGFVVERDRDITSNVLASCDQIAKSRIGAHGAGSDTARMNDFLGAPGSHFYEEMRAKRWAYRIYKLRKSEERSPSAGN